MITDKLKSSGTFWDIKAQEKAVAEHFNLQIDATERAITLAKTMTALNGSPGYDQMVNAIGELESAANTQLLNASTPEAIWRLQGRVNTFRDIRNIMTNAEHRITELDSQLARLQDERSAMLRPDGKVNQQG